MSAHVCVFVYVHVCVCVCVRMCACFEWTWTSHKSNIRTAKYSLHTSSNMCPVHGLWGVHVCEVQVRTSVQRTCLWSGTLLSACLHLSSMFMGNLKKKQARQITLTTGSDTIQHSIRHLVCMWMCVGVLHVCVYYVVQVCTATIVGEAPTFSLGPEEHQERASAC